MFSGDGSKAYLLAGTRDRLAIVSGKTLREEGGFPLPGPIAALAIGEKGAFWVLSGDRLFRFDPVRGEPSLTVTLPRPGRALVAVVLRPGKGFACF